MSMLTDLMHEAINSLWNLNMAEYKRLLLVNDWCYLYFLANTRGKHGYSVTVLF